MVLLLLFACSNAHNTSSQSEDTTSKATTDTSTQTDRGTRADEIYMTTTHFTNNKDGAQGNDNEVELVPNDDMEGYCYRRNFKYAGYHNHRSFHATAIIHRMARLLSKR